MDPFDVYDMRIYISSMNLLLEDGCEIEYTRKAIKNYKEKKINLQ